MTRKRRFLSQKEYEFIIQRIDDDRSDTTVEPFNLRKYLSAGLDLNIWVFGFIYFCTTTTAYAISYFLPLIYQEGMGFSQEASLLLFAPPYAAAGIVMYAESWFGDRYRIRGPILVFNAVLTLVGLPLMVRCDPVFFSTECKVNYTNQRQGFGKGTASRLVGSFLTTIGANSNVPAAMAYQVSTIGHFA